MLLISAGRQVTQECPRLGVVALGLVSQPAGQLLELGPGVDGQAVILALGDHQPSCQRVPELGGQRQPPLVVELGRVGAQKHQATSRHGTKSRNFVSPTTSATIPHNAPLCSIYRVRTRRFRLRTRNRRGSAVSQFAYPRRISRAHHLENLADSRSGALWGAG